MARSPEAIDNRLAVLDDPRYQPFKDSQFNAAVFTSKVLTGAQTTALSKSEELRESLRILENALSQVVQGSHRELLLNAKRVLDTESLLQDVITSIDYLQTAIKRVRAEVAGPYDQIKLKSKQLANLHGTVNLLRNVIYRLKLTQKLRIQLASPAGAVDLAKAAKLYTDIKLVDKETDFAGVDVVNADDDFLKEAGGVIREQAQAMLQEGMESMSQAKVGSALQVFFNLEELDLAVNALLGRYVVELDRGLKAAVDSRQLGASSTATSVRPGPGGMPSGVPGAGPSLQDKLWSGLKGFMDQASAAALAVWHLQRVVAKKRDPLTHICFLDVLAPAGMPSLTQRFWDGLVRIMSDCLSSVSRPTKGGWVREVLISAYPRLAALIEAAVEKLQGETMVKGVAGAVSRDQLVALLDATAPFQHAYMSAALARMTDAVSIAFPGGTRALPSPADVQKCIGCMHEELKVAGNSPQLASMIATMVGKALNQLAERAEYMAASASEVRRLAGSCSAAQARNIMLCSHLQEVHRSLVGLLPKLPQTAATVLAGPFETVQASVTNIAVPLLRAVAEALEERLLKMHGHDFGTTDPDAMTNTSAYMVDTIQLIAQVRSEYLTRFVPPPSPSAASCVAALVERLASRVLGFFVRHASLVRPLSQVGKLQLAKDLAELQAAVSTHLWPLEQLGAPYKALRAFRTLLFIDNADLASSPLLREIPATTLLHHLFSRLPSSILAPHERGGLSPVQYSTWLEQHSAAEVLRSVRTALDAADSKARKDAAAAEIVAIMLKLCSQQP